MNDFSAAEYGEEPASGNFLEQLPSILWHRRWWIIVPTLLGAIAAAAAYFVIPPVYQSNAVMLVESPQLPESVIGTTKGELVQRRIARIREQVTSRPALLSMIEQHGLYQDQRQSQPLSELIQRMRDAITIAPAAGGDDESAIAFQISFEYQEPAPAQAVAQDLMDDVLELDYSGTLEQATGTVQFLADQAAVLEQQIAQLQGQISSVKAQYGGVLGGGGLMVGADPTSYDMQIASLQRDNASLMAQKNIALGSDERSPVVQQAESALAAARAVYAESHPDVIFAKQRLAEARELAKQNVDRLPLEGVNQQIANNNSQIATLRAAKERAQSQIAASMANQARQPLVQQQISELEQELSVLDSQYQSVQDQLLEARTGVRAEDEQMGERLVVVDPPVVPDAPVRPNRLLITAAGLGGGLALGFLLALAIELFLRPIRDPKTLQGITGAAPLAVVPVIKSRSRRRSVAFWRRSPS
ncbi:lipopolysaccharide biosynthesis protein [Altererythrobacter sp. SALINAS58]|uniref:Wzz/FepE/Etk N-terminal domain-containing protein n=1 Tax=Alteripontixanthobacter muriae TaxID=2705546 RepID=UPI0015755937|nr:Wzz/FepE/Etk N-terminal domain-containing protein [Alteripontixanthobacter muriae]NTZ43953.1 lipopolysaccharide biosynthesis protein [Alteripontixanthobacter muriae]